MYCNVWCDKNLCSTNLCDLCLTHIICINKSHAEICTFTVQAYISPSFCDPLHNGIGIGIGSSGTGVLELELVFLHK